MNPYIFALIVIGASIASALFVYLFNLHVTDYAHFQLSIEAGH